MQMAGREMNLFQFSAKYFQAARNHLTSAIRVTAKRIFKFSLFSSYPTKYLRFMSALMTCPTELASEIISVCT